MTDSVFRYPLDLTGASADNLVVDEVHNITGMGGRLFAPQYGPFFDNTGLSLVEVGTDRPLTPHVDYLLVHYYREASAAAGQAVYAGIRVLDTVTGSAVRFSGQMVGGEYSYSYYAIQQAIEAVNQASVDVGWGDLVGTPSQFPVSDHTHAAYMVYGLKHVVDSLADIEAAIRDGNLASRELILSQIRDKFGELDAFMQEMADGYGTAATELSVI